MSDPVLTIRNLSKSFGAVMATDDVTLDLCTGEIHAIIGPNGAGKSTLIAQICGTVRADTGTILLGGREITKMAVNDRARAGLARTFQVSNLAGEGTVLENAMLGVMGASDTVWQFWKPARRAPDLIRKAQAALQAVGLADLSAAAVASLSHGQRRLLEVAIALTLKPKVFLMDEPMAGLGTDGTAALTTLLDALRTRAPILLVEHDMQAVFALADRISVLDRGRIIATGTVDAVRADPAARRAYLGDAA